MIRLRSLSFPAKGGKPIYLKEKHMNRRIMLLAVAACLAAAGMPAVAPVFAQDQQNAPTEQAGAPYMVPTGTRFLVSLQDVLCTKEDKAGKRFHVRTLEPLTASDGSVLASGAEVRGHIDKIQPAAKAGRARIWLTFDDIQTPQGRRPLVAELIDAPGVHSIRVVYDHEGEIESSTSKRQREAEAAAAGAIAGAAPGIAARNSKDAAIGAAVGAATAFLVTSGLGQELTIEKDTKLELVLARPLYLGRT
jgi:hypothetical protein